MGDDHRVLRMGFDVCPDDKNVSQSDCNGNGVGDACDPLNCIYADQVSTTVTPGPNIDWVDMWELGSSAHLSFSTTGGEDEEEIVEHMASVAFCACDDMDDDYCVRRYCMQDEEDHRVDFHGWYPISWFENRDCDRDAEGYCQPIPDVP
ncbi:MAG: hypothetical protein JXR96_09370, partial [Deltaproteobacteria bacterium]|nr:hypothetical protein [Deltaproteobacteria bacterium]